MITMKIVEENCLPLRLLPALAPMKSHFLDGSINSKYCVHH